MHKLKADHLIVHQVLVWMPNGFSGIHSIHNSVSEWWDSDVTGQMGVSLENSGDEASDVDVEDSRSTITEA